VGRDFTSQGKVILFKKIKRGKGNMSDLFVRQKTNCAQRYKAVEKQLEKLNFGVKTSFQANRHE
jgi:hypothetical protein